MANHSSPKHGSSPKTFPEKKDARPENKPSVSQADGSASDSPQNETQAQPQAGAPEPSGMGPTGQNPATAGPGSTNVVSDTPENRTGEINPSGPADGTEGAMTNMGSITEGLPENPNMNSFGEIGEPTGKGNIDIRPETFRSPDVKSDAKSERQHPQGFTPESSIAGNNPTESRPGKEGAGNLREPGSEPRSRKSKKKNPNKAA